MQRAEGVSVVGCRRRAQHNRVRAALLAGTSLCAIALLAPDAAQAVDGIWAGPGSSWTTGANWNSTPAVPDGTAIFTNNGAPTTVTISATTSIGTIRLEAGAPAYGFALQGFGTLFQIVGAGIVNNSAFAPSITIATHLSYLDFNNASMAGNAVITNYGGITFNHASTAGNAAITNNNDIQFLITSTADSATITNNGLLLFYDTSTAGNATIINANFGALAFVDSSTAGNATIITRNGGTTYIQDAASGGQARFITEDGGWVDISVLTIAGTTAGSIEGAGTYLLGSQSLTVGGNNLSTTVSGVIADGGVWGGIGGSLVKVGSGTLTLAGANTYTGSTTVNAGTLIVDGSIASSVLTTVNAGGTLGGNGTVGTTTINGGILAPGALTVQGDLVFGPAATYRVAVSPTTADHTTVTGSAALGGTVQAVLAPGTYVARSYTILSAAGGLSGRFGGVSTSTPNVVASLGYAGNDVLLNLTAMLGVGAGLAGNPQNVATAINTAFNGGAPLLPGFADLFLLTGGQLASALARASGEAATGAQYGAFQIGGQFLGLMLDPFVDGRGGGAGTGGGALAFAPERDALPPELALAYAKVTKAPAAAAQPAPFEQRWSAWGGAYGGANKTSGDPATAGSHDLTARTAGFAAGMDYRVTPDSVIGFALAGGGTSWGLAQGLGGGTSDAVQAGVYGATRAGPLQLAAALAFTNHWISTERSAPFGDRLTARFNAQSLGARLEGGYRVGTPVTGLTPYAAVQAQSFHTPAYRETDINGLGFALGIGARNASATRSELGARLDHVALVDAIGVLTLRGRLAWAHDWVSDPALTAVFQGLPGTGFIVTGATPARDLALVSAGAELKLAGGVTLAGKFDAELANGANTYAGTGSVRWTW